MIPPPVQILILDSYLTVIKNSLGANLFRNLFALVDGDRQDILKNGELSCAFFASAILLQFGLIKEGHTVVAGLIKDLENSDWEKIPEPRPGAVLIWEPQEFDGGIHSHCGFYISADQAISNNTTTGVPARHHWTFGQKNGQPIRKITAIYWHLKLNSA